MADDSELCALQIMRLQNKYTHRLCAKDSEWQSNENKKRKIEENESERNEEKCTAISCNLDCRRLHNEQRGRWHALEINSAEMNLWQPSITDDGVAIKLSPKIHFHSTHQRLGDELIFISAPFSLKPVEIDGVGVQMRVHCAAKTTIEEFHC